MTNKKHTKRALAASLLSMMLCVTMLIGSTFAWFTDTASTGVNKIEAGNLDIALSYKNAKMTEYKEVDKSTTDLFVNKDGQPMEWEPGAVAVTNFKFENKGSLAVDYVLSMIGQDIVTYNGVKLSDALKVAVIENGSYTTREEALAAAQDADSESILDYKYEAAEVKAQATREFAVIVYMPEGIGNTYNLPTTDADGNPVEALQIELYVSLVASQAQLEKDSFGDDYDANAPYPESASATFSPSNNQDTVIKGRNITATIPAAAKLSTVDENGDKTEVTVNTEVTIVVEPISENANLKIEDAKVETYEISLEDGNGNKLTSDKEITVVMNIGANREGNIELYHNETKVDNAVYTKNTGELKFATKDFSPYTIVERIMISEDEARALLNQGGEVDFKGMVMFNEIVGDNNYGANLREYTFKEGTTVKNLILKGNSGATRWLHTEGDVTFENCTFEAGAVYAAHFDSGEGTITFKNCNFYGWSSFGGTFDKVVFDHCTFDEAVKENSWGLLRFYCNGEIKNCTFLDDFDRIDNAAAGITITIDGGTGYEGKMFCNGDPATMAATWIVNGEDISSTIE